MPMYFRFVFFFFLQVMPYSTGCKTPLSNFEAGQEYRVCDLKPLFTIHI
jgi:isoleucyl-tRNA synthetase